ncbi:MAG: voltage-gated potassium channel [Methanobacteriaceae archaeon]|nr:voltage-gated potassium channel [Methanobacteriaceae archaeon]
MGGVVKCGLTQENVEEVHFLPSKDKFMRYKELILVILILIDMVAIIYISFYPVGSNLADFVNNFDLILCILLSIEFLYNLRREEDKWAFIRENWPDIMAFLPITFFRGFRFVRIFRLLKVFALFRKYLKGLFNFLLETHVDQAIGILLFAILCGTLFFYITENGVNPYLKGLTDSLWSTITTTMSGEVVINPVTLYGKAITSILMFVGITFVGFLTASLASWFVKSPESEKEFHDKIEIIEKKGWMNFEKKLES